MKVTVLYLHDTTACWMQWRGKRLLQVHTESVTRDLAERAVESSKQEGIQSQCPWLSVYSPKVRLVINPVVDQTRSLPAFDHGFMEPRSFIDRLRRRCVQLYITCRSLTSDVLADDLTRYRQDLLSNYPKSILQWQTPRLRMGELASPAFLPAWLITDTGVPDFVYDWLQSLAEHGLEFVDVRPVSELFAIEHQTASNAGITVWAQGVHWRMIVSAWGAVYRVEQFSTEMDARIAVDEAINELKDLSVEADLRFTGSQADFVYWQEVYPDASYCAPGAWDGLTAELDTPLFESLPTPCRELPLQAMVHSRYRSKMASRQNPQRIDVGATIRVLLSTARWRRRYKQSGIATTVAAAFSGYFVLLRMD